MVKAFTIFFLTTCFLTVASLDRAAPVSEGYGGLDEHIINGLGPNLTEFLSVLAAVAVTIFAKGAFILIDVPLAKH